MASPPAQRVRISSEFKARNFTAAQMRKEAYRPTPGCRSWLSPTAFPKAMVRCCRNRAAILPMTSPRGPAFRPVQSSWHALSLFFVKFFALLLLLLIRFSSYTLLGVWLCVGAEQYLLAEVSIFLPNVTAFCVHIRIYISFVWRRRRSHARLARFPLRVVKTHTHKKKKARLMTGCRLLARRHRGGVFLLELHQSSDLKTTVDTICSKYCICSNASPTDFRARELRS